MGMQLQQNHHWKKNFYNKDKYALELQDVKKRKTGSDTGVHESRKRIAALKPIGFSYKEISENGSCDDEIYNNEIHSTESNYKVERKRLI